MVEHKTGAAGVSLVDVEFAKEGSADGTADVSADEQTEFKVGIKDPTADDGSLLGIVTCKNKTVVTSGTYERYFEKDGVRYHHILDVKTGYPIETDVLSVTIISDRGNSADCDGLSTTCLVLGMDKGMELVKSLDGFEAVFVDVEGNVEFSSDDIKF